MFANLFLRLRSAGIPVSLREYLTLHEALAVKQGYGNLDDFYALARAALVKDERYYDTFDRVFGSYVQGLAAIPDQALLEIPQEWLRQELYRTLTDEEKAAIEALGGLDKLLERLQQLYQEQQGKHQGGNTWIGTGGTSPYGHGGYNPEGIRIGGQGTQRRAVKVWEQRTYQNLDEHQALSTRSLQVALRKLRRLTREGTADSFDLEGTIRGTARNGGVLDIAYRPSRQNRAKLLLLLDVGGSMTPHAERCAELFAAARHTFKHLAFYYFHNFVYERLWQDNTRRWSEATPTWEVLRTYNPDYYVVWVGDAAMSPYEVLAPGGSVEHTNAEAGAVWFERFLRHYPRTVWLNPDPEAYWDMTESTALIRQMLRGRMYPLTLAGLDQAIDELRRPSHPGA